MPGMVTLEQYKDEAKRVIFDIIKALPPDDIRTEIEEGISAAINDISQSMERLHCKCGTHVADVPLSSNFSANARIICQKCSRKYIEDINKLRDCIKNFHDHLDHLDRLQSISGQELIYPENVK